MSIVEMPSVPISEQNESDVPILHEGWVPALGRMLVEKSQEPFIEEWAPKDASECFPDAKAANRWYRVQAKKPLVVWLGTLTGDLVGFAGITHPVRSRKDETGTSVFFARVYDGYRNQGYGTILGEELHRRYDEISHRSTQFTMQTNNNAAFALGIKFGYRLEKDTAIMQTLVRRR